MISTYQNYSTSNPTGSFITSNGATQPIALNSISVSSANSVVHTSVGADTDPKQLSIANSSCTSLALGWSTRSANCKGTNKGTLGGWTATNPSGEWRYFLVENNSAQ